MSSKVLAETSLCLHCGQGIPSDRSVFCCQGCEIVSNLLREADLSRFYDLKPKKLIPQINYFTRQEDFNWLEELPGMSSGFLSLGVEGLQCAACVWVLQEVARRMDPGVRIDVDLVLGRLTINFNPDRFQVRDYAHRLFRLGYRLRQAGTETVAANDGLLLRLGVCAAIAMNTMFLAFTIYAGLDHTEPDLFGLIGRINFYLTFVSVVVGGSYFFQKAYLTLRQGILHFDLTISVGILAAFIGSVSLHLNGRGSEAYFDTINVFITLMLAGRYLQERVIAKNRNNLLIKNEINQLKILRVNTGLVPVSLEDVKNQDELLLQAGGMVPVDSCMLDSQAEFSMSWISGESLPVIFNKDQVIPAGAQLASRTAVKIRALSNYEVSPLKEMQPIQKEEPFMSVVWQWVVARYVIIVFMAAILGSVVWLFKDASRALNVLTAILVVTCPCSLGVAIPMARVAADYSLRKKGVFIRGASVLDKIIHVKNVFLDKTGTLTMANLDWANKDQILSRLEKEDVRVLYSMVLQSRHPASLSVYQELSTSGIQAIDLRITEIPGRGIKCQYQQNVYSFGSFFDSSHSESADYEVGFFKDEKLLAILILKEKLLDQALEAISNLKHQNISVFLLSGDKSDRVSAMADKLQMSHYFGALLPEDKARIVSEKNKNLKKDEVSLVIGDGLNDVKAFEAAHLAGTPIWDYSGMASGADFYYISGSMDWLGHLFKTAKILNQTIRMNLFFSLFFNLSAIAFAIAGFVSPLIAAIIMPVGSVGILSLTMTRMRMVDA